jgi:hypothetical protein
MPSIHGANDRTGQATVPRIQRLVEQTLTTGQCHSFLRSYPMISRPLIAAAIAALSLAACDSRSSTTLTEPSLAGARRVSANLAVPQELHVTKDCSSYFGRAGDSCTIVTSNVAAIPAQSRVVYAVDAVGTDLDTDVTLYAAGSSDVAFGHCALSLATGIGKCKFSGGTGALAGFHAKADVSPLGGPVFAWDGSYHFAGEGE